MKFSVILVKSIEANYSGKPSLSLNACSYLILGRRKLMLCALALSNEEAGLEIYSEMSESNRMNPSTQYLLYKIALRLGDIGQGDLDLNRPFTI